MIASLSGIRGILNEDLTLADASKFARNFAKAVDSKEFLLARDTRRTGPALAKAVAAGLMSEGGTVRDYGVVSTPALFRESRRMALPGVMVTASHNEPEYNGLKFLVEGAGIGSEVFDRVVNGKSREKGEIVSGHAKSASKPSYEDDLVDRYGTGSFDGVKVALDLGGGAAISHAVSILGRLGCDLSSINDTPGIFNRRIDPISDDLTLLKKLTKENGCEIGLGFDCDGDRLAIVDYDGRKRTGDFMLTLALSEMLREAGPRKVVVSLDTTQAVDDVAKRAGAEVFRAKVGEANVVKQMNEHGARLGGEGSSGGLIDGSFNYCRDSMLAALSIIKALERDGREFYKSVPTYHQERVALRIPRKKAEKAIQKMARSLDADLTDGLKATLPNNSWVLIRPSGTEDVVRVSAEAASPAKASQIIRAFSKKLKGLSS